MKIQTSDERLRVRAAIWPFVDLYEGERTIRTLNYAVRRQYYTGQIKPKVEPGHEQISSEICSAIANKMGYYVGNNVPRINMAAKDIANQADSAGAQVAENVLEDIMDASDWKEVFSRTNMVAAWSGDGFIGSRKKDGFTELYDINRPQNVMLGWKTDNYKELDYWAYIYGLSKQSARAQFGEDFATIYNEVQLDIVTWEAGHPYGFGTTRISEQKRMQMVKITDFNCFMDIYDPYDHVTKLLSKGDNVVLINDSPYFINPGEAKRLYYFPANVYPTSPNGVPDFEHVAQMVTMYDKKLSEEADAVSQSVYHKFVTNDRNASQLQEKLKPNKTQIIKLMDENSKLDVLNLNSNGYNSEPLIKNLLNIIRTNCFLQELCQDQISPNISGRALTMIYQGAIQRVNEKRIRWESIIKKMAIDLLTDAAKTIKELDGVLFDENGQFKYNIQITWPDVLPSDDQSKVVTVQSMRQGIKPLVSDLTAMTMIGIPNPLQESKRIDEEVEENMRVQQAMQASMQPQQTAGPTLTTDQNQPEQGVPSGVGMAGSAQMTVSPEGAAAKTKQNNQAKGV